MIKFYLAWSTIKRTYFCKILIYFFIPTQWTMYFSDPKIGIYYLNPKNSSNQNTNFLFNYLSNTVLFYLYTNINIWSYDNKNEKRNLIYYSFYFLYVFSIRFGPSWNNKGFASCSIGLEQLQSIHKRLDEQEATPFHRMITNNICNFEGYCLRK